MTRFTTLLLGLLLVASSAAAQVTQKTLLKTFNLNGNQQVVFNLDGEIAVKEWSNDYMRIYIEISYFNADENMLKFLVSEGRYNLSQSENADGFLVESPKRSAPIIISRDGLRLDEVVRYTIYLPTNVKAKFLNQPQVQVGQEVPFAAPAPRTSQR